MVNLPRWPTAPTPTCSSAAWVRQGWAIRPQLKIVEGRKFEPGLREIVVGRGAQTQFRGLEGRASSSSSPTRRGPWSARSSPATRTTPELWADADVLGPAYQRQAFQSITVKLDGTGRLQAAEGRALAADPRLKLDAETTRAYYSKQSAQLEKLNILGIVIGTIIG